VCSPGYAAAEYHQKIEEEKIGSGGEDFAGGEDWHGLTIKGKLAARIVINVEGFLIS